MNLLTVFDFETTGLKVEKGDRAIELAMVGYDLDEEKEVFAFCKRFYTIKQIDPKASLVHHIYNKDLVDCKPFSDYIPTINKILKVTNILAGHNIIGFDVPFLLAEFDHAKAIISNSDPKMLDTMLESRWATWNGKQPNLGELCYAFEVDYDPDAAHSALYDVQVNLKCILEGIKRGVYLC